MWCFGHVSFQPSTVLASTAMLAFFHIIFILKDTFMLYVTGKGYFHWTFRYVSKSYFSWTVYNLLLKSGIYQKQKQLQSAMAVKVLHY